jgi:hypothetical protein
MVMFKQKLPTLAGFLSGIVVLALPIATHAVFDENTLIKPTEVPSGTITFTKIVGNLYNKTFAIFGVIAGSLAVLYLIWAGIQYIQAGGDASKAKAARTSIINAIIGIVIVIAAFALVRIGVIIGRWIASAV